MSTHRLKNIALPEKLRCERCQKWKAADEDKENFSKKQLAIVRNNIYYYGPGHLNTIKVNCAMCNSKQVSELHCSICLKDKGLESFSRAQRRTPDSPVSTRYGGVLKPN